MVAERMSMEQLEDNLSIFQTEAETNSELARKRYDSYEEARRKEKESKAIVIALESIKAYPEEDWRVQLAYAKGRAEGAFLDLEEHKEVLSRFVDWFEDRK
jgi:CRISPR/Cas system CSM-associated protein Csm2 small subunit